MNERPQRIALLTGAKGSLSVSSQKSPAMGPDVKSILTLFPIWGAILAVPGWWRQKGWRTLTSAIGS